MEQRKRNKRSMIHRIRDFAVYGAVAFTMAAVIKGTIGRPLPLAEPELCDTAQETIYVAEVQRSETNIETERQTEAESASEIHCTDPASAWVEKISLDYSASDAYLLTKIAYAEAGIEDVVGQALVIRVVLNRVRSDEFPDTISEVIYQTEPDVQFAATMADGWQTMQPSQTSWDALELVETGDLDGLLPDWAGQATYFCRIGESQWHEEHLEKLGTWGAHDFYWEGGDT